MQAAPHWLPPIAVRVGIITRESGHKSGDNAHKSSFDGTRQDVEHHSRVFYSFSILVQVLSNEQSKLFLTSYTG